MTSNQVRLLIHHGFYVGGHGIDHPKFDELSLEEQLHQTLGCLDRLAEEFSLQRRIFSFPFTARGLSDAYFSAVLTKDVIEAFFGTGGFGVNIQKRLFDRVSFDDMTRPGLKRKYLEYLGQGSKAP